MKAQRSRARFVTIDGVRIKLAPEPATRAAPTEPGPTWHERYRMGCAGLRELLQELTECPPDVEPAVHLGVTREEARRFVDGGRVAFEEWTRAHVMR